MLNGAQFGVVGTRPLPADTVGAGFQAISDTINVAGSAAHGGSSAAHQGLSGAFGEGAGGAAGEVGELAALA